MKNIIVILIIGLTLAWHNSFGQEAKKKERGEPWRRDTAMLPQYCKDRASNKLLFIQKWGKTFGDATQHMHHYCGGIYAEQQAKSSLSSGGRGKYLGEVIHQMGYVSKHCPASGCVLYPELHARWGWALGQKGQAGEAIKHYQLALQKNPKYTLAYAQLSDLYVDLNQPEEAKKILQSGLKVKPSSRMLQRRMKELETAPESPG